MNGLRVLVADPDPAGLPAPLLLLKFLLLFTFVVHLFFMNVTLGGGLALLWANLRARSAARRAKVQRGGQPAGGVNQGGASMEEPRAWDGSEATAYRTLASVIGKSLPVTTAFAITTGVAPLLFVQLVYGQVFYTSSILMAWMWLAVVGLLLVGYYANYGISFARPGTARAAWLGLVSAAMFVTVGFIFTNNMTLMLRPEMHAPLYFASDAGLHANIGDAWVWPRFAHMLVASLAATGLVVAWIARVRRGLDRPLAAWIERRGVRLFIAATLAEFAVGIGFFVALPFPVREVFVGGNTPDPLLLAAGVAFAALSVLIVRRSLAIGTLALVVAIVDMAVVRDRVRTLMLEPYFRPESLPLAPQTGAFLLFAVLLVAGLGVVAWMVWKYVAARPPAPRNAAGV